MCRGQTELVARYSGHLTIGCEVYEDTYSIVRICIPGKLGRRPLEDLGALWCIKSLEREEHR